MHALDGCRWAPRWVSHLGAIRGCLDCLGVAVSDGWLYGGTGHAFVLNMHESVCPSSPTAWNTKRTLELGRNVGYHVEGVFSERDADEFAQRQADAWALARESIDGGMPCYAWELEIPEFYVVYGHDDAGYYYSGPGREDGGGPKPWAELGLSDIGVLELYAVRPCEPAQVAVTVRDALSFALDHAHSPGKWTFEHYRSGLEGYDNWVGALETGVASDMGMRYNTGVWLECRKNAVEFLKEAKQRLPGRADAAFDRALSRFASVAQGLEEVAQLYPWEWEASDERSLPVDETSRAAAEALRIAKQEEAAGLGALADIVHALG